jgi:hypothetical protein
MKKTNLLKRCKVFASILLTGICLQATAQENKPTQALPSDQKAKTDAQLEYEAKMRANNVDLNNPRAQKYRAAKDVNNNASKEVNQQAEQKANYAALTKPATLSEGLTAENNVDAKVPNTKQVNAPAEKQKLTVEQYTAQFNAKVKAITAKAQNFQATETLVMDLFERELESASAYFANEQIEAVIVNFKKSITVEMQKLQDKLVNSNN